MPYTYKDIHAAAKTGNAVQAMAILSQQPELISSRDLDCYGNPLVLTAVKHGNIQLVKLLYKLHQRREDGSEKTLFDQQNDDGTGTFIMGFLGYERNLKTIPLKNYITIIRYILEKGLDLNALQNRQSLSLCLMLPEPERSEILKILLDKGLNPNILIFDSMAVVLGPECSNSEIVCSALYIACSRFSKDTLKYISVLLEHPDTNFNMLGTVDGKPHYMLHPIIGFINRCIQVDKELVEEYLNDFFKFLKSKRIITSKDLVHELINDAYRYLHEVRGESYATLLESIVNVGIDNLEDYMAQFDKQTIVKFKHICLSRTARDNGVKLPDGHSIHLLELPNYWNSSKSVEFSKEIFKEYLDLCEKYPYLVSNFCNNIDLICSISHDTPKYPIYYSTHVYCYSELKSYTACKLASKDPMLETVKREMLALKNDATYINQLPSEQRETLKYLSNFSFEDVLADPIYQGIITPCQLALNPDLYTILRNEHELDTTSNNDTTAVTGNKNRCAP